MSVGTGSNEAPKQRCVFKGLLWSGELRASSGAAQDRRCLLLISLRLSPSTYIVMVGAVRDGGGGLSGAASC